MLTQRHKHSLRARIKEFLLPPIEDGLVLGTRSPIGHIAVGKALTLLSSTAYQHLPIEDDVISDVLIRSAILRKISSEFIVAFVLREIKPLMGAEEILHLGLDVELTIESDER
ncbi:MAG TPA: hypothetical protein VHX12_05065 [Acidisoma sp.]|jgi:hypothetical protein|nr:hypothetical protein [Acidisoma sp.]